MIDYDKWVNIHIPLNSVWRSLSLSIWIYSLCSHRIYPMGGTLWKSVTVDRHTHTLAMNHMFFHLLMTHTTLGEN
jgi:hypothetical protein